MRVWVHCALAVKYVFVCMCACAHVIVSTHVSEARYTASPCCPAHLCFNDTCVCVCVCKNWPAGGYTV